MTDVSKITIGGDGPRHCDICFVGEAPGETEIQQGKPFVGSAGKLFNRLLQGAGILRNQCYITNVVKERPPNNNIGEFISFSRGGMVASNAYRQYEQQLYEELAMCTAKVIVPLGNVPLYALTRHTSITKWRGSIVPAHDDAGQVAGRKVIPTIHPAAAMRQYQYTHLITLDLKRILCESSTESIHNIKRDIILEPTFAETIAYLQSILDNCNRVAVDIEVVNEEVSCISFAKSAQDVICIPFTAQGQPYFPPDQELDVWLLIGHIMKEAQIEKVGQNIIFDVTFLLRRMNIHTVNVKDTMVAQGILCPEMPKGLDFITSVYTTEPYYKDDGKKYYKIGGDERAFWRYNALDSAVCLEALPKQEADIGVLRNAETYSRHTRLIAPLIFMHERGIRMDVDRLRKESTQAEVRLNELERELTRAAGQLLNPNSPKQVKDYFYTQRKIKPYYKRGRQTTDESALRRIAAKGYDEAAIILEMRHIRKMKGTYYDVQLDDDNRLRCSFNPVGTTSGRLSSSKTIFGTGANLQNQPMEMKRCMLADEGYLLYEIDLSQAENRVVAYIAPEPTMIAAFENKVDIHKQTASLIYRLPIEAVNREQRQDGKKANHGFNYGWGARSFAIAHQMEERQAKFIQSRYFEVYPGVRQYHNWIRTRLGKGRILENVMGRRRMFLDRWGDSLFKEAYSFIPQSTVADIINEHGLLYIYENQEEFYEVELLNQVHDSIVFQIPISIGLHRHAAMVKKICDSLEVELEWQGLTFSIPAEVKVGYNGLDAVEVKGRDDSNDESELEQRLIQAKNILEESDGAEPI